MFSFLCIISAYTSLRRVVLYDCRCLVFSKGGNISISQDIKFIKVFVNLHMLWISFLKVVENKKFNLLVAQFPLWVDRLTNTRRWKLVARYWTRKINAIYCSERVQYWDPKRQVLPSPAICLLNCKRNVWPYDSRHVFFRCRHWSTLDHHFKKTSYVLGTLS